MQWSNFSDGVLDDVRYCLPEYYQDNYYRSSMSGVVVRRLLETRLSRCFTKPAYVKRGRLDSAAALSVLKLMQCSHPLPLCTIGRLERPRTSQTLNNRTRPLLSSQS